MRLKALFFVWGRPFRGEVVHAYTAEKNRYGHTFVRAYASERAPERLRAQVVNRHVAVCGAVTDHPRTRPWSVSSVRKCYECSRILRTACP